MAGRLSRFTSKCWDITILKGICNIYQFKWTKTSSNIGQTLETTWSYGSTKSWQNSSNRNDRWNPIYYSSDRLLFCFGVAISSVKKEVCAMLQEASNRRAQALWFLSTWDGKGTMGTKKAVKNDKMIKMQTTDFGSKCVKTCQNHQPWNTDGFYSLRRPETPASLWKAPYSESSTGTSILAPMLQQQLWNESSVLFESNMGVSGPHGRYGWWFLTQSPLKCCSNPAVLVDCTTPSGTCWYMQSFGFITCFV